jgi:hypothetical protein
MGVQRVTRRTDDDDDEHEHEHEHDTRLNEYKRFSRR